MTRFLKSALTCILIVGTLGCQGLGCPEIGLSVLGCTLFLRGGGLCLRLRVGFVVVCAGCRKTLEGRFSLLLGGIHSWERGIGTGVVMAETGAVEGADVGVGTGVRAGLLAQPTTSLSLWKFGSTLEVPFTLWEALSFFWTLGGLLSPSGGLALRGPESTLRGSFSVLLTSTTTVLRMSWVFGRLSVLWGLESALLRLVGRPLVICENLSDFLDLLSFLWRFLSDTGAPISVLEGLLLLSDTCVFLSAPLYLCLFCPADSRLLWRRIPLPRPLLFLSSLSMQYSVRYNSSVAWVTRSSWRSKASKAGRILRSVASISALSFQPWPPTIAPRPKVRPSPRPGASARLQGLLEVGSQEASDPPSTLSGVGGASGVSRGGRHKDLQSLVEEDLEGGSSIPSNRTLCRNYQGRKG